MKRQIFSLAAAGLVLAGCDTYTTQQYQSSELPPENRTLT
ncbi:hypothetical protein ROG8370_02700 [Roseovarius gaetbuli]|uniref:Lipoprotein n=1 Tax=Roseovarius gaetbuli TaxID=1356575 RepID=A0A1X6ZR20_9RHOB|nr:hypothetical protein ROG8370_02700 [Roseovarius gaetbuli]